ncbi:MAG: ATP-dependent zinc metalloprotease FtsH [Acidobacteriota bacterium]|nr:ATP-dependent zinc metalloprotease FtsH [Acidobacteriota bacterium]
MANGKVIVFWISLFAILIALYMMTLGTNAQVKRLKYSEFLDLVQRGEIQTMVIEDQEIRGLLMNGESYSVVVPPSTELTPVIDLARKNHISVEARKQGRLPLYSILLNALPFLLLFLLLVAFMRQMQSGSNRALSFGKSRARLFQPHQGKVTFNDVAGIEEVKEEVQEIIEFLKNPQKFRRLGGRIPKGVLLIGPPGTGKTLLAKAIAGEAGVPFLSISGSDFVEMFVGVGAARVRDLFDQAKKHAPCIVFIDEIDAVGRQRGAGIGGGHDEREQTLNQLLVEMDGFDSSEGIIICAATNRPDILDPALLRPGRFDRRIYVPLPDVKGREAILRVHCRNKPLADDVDLSRLARGTPGFSGADLANMVNEAALLAARRNHSKITMQDFEDAKDKVIMGLERKSLVMSEEEKRLTAYHESGHALLAYYLPHADPLHKVTIIPRGGALGVTTQLPEDDRHNYSRDYLMDTICILLGGRASEEIFMQTITTGSGNDLEKATDLARRMVCYWGMSDKVGPMTVGRRQDEILFGRDFIQRAEYSEHIAQIVDEEVRRILNEQYERACRLIEEHRDKLVLLAETLLEYETLTAEEIRQLLETGEVRQPTPSGGPPPTKPSPSLEQPKVPGTWKPEPVMG